MEQNCPFWTSVTTNIPSLSLFNNLTWDESFIGEIKNYAFTPPKNITDKVICLFHNDSVDYCILEKYNEDVYYIEQIKTIFNIDRRKYHLCTYKSKPYFLFCYKQDCEISTTIGKIKKTDVNLQCRQQIILMWILGVSSKLWKCNDKLYTRKYGIIDYTKNDFKKTTVKKFFPSKTELEEAIDIFKDEEKLQKLQELLKDKNSWYFSIISKINSI